MTRFRPALAVLLALLLGVSALGFGMARGQAPQAGQIVICTGQGIVTISIDADGKPVERHTLCPDAALTLMAAVATAPPVVAADDLPASWRNWPAATRAPRVFPPLAGSARAPPA